MEEVADEAVEEEVAPIGAPVPTIKRWKRVMSYSKSCIMSSAWFQKTSAKNSGTLFAKNYQTASDSQDQKGMLHWHKPESLEKY